MDIPVVAFYLGLLAWMVAAEYYPFPINLFWPGSRCQKWSAKSGPLTSLSPTHSYLRHEIKVGSGWVAVNSGLKPRLLGSLERGTMILRTFDQDTMTKEMNGIKIKLFY